MDSYYNLLKEYNSTLVQDKLPGVFEYLEVQENATKYPGLRVSIKFSTIFLPPMSHCNPIDYMYDDDLSKKTINAHTWINSYEPDLGCDANTTQHYDKGVR